MKAVMKDPIKPTSIKKIWFAVNKKLASFRSKIVAAVIVGMASKNENSTAVFRFVPKKSPDMIVAADRDTPGITAIAWKRPMRAAFL